MGRTLSDYLDRCGYIPSRHYVNYQMSLPDIHSPDYGPYIIIGALISFLWLDAYDEGQICSSTTEKGVRYGVNVPLREWNLGVVFQSSDYECNLVPNHPASVTNKFLMGFIGSALSRNS
jgi:hypothetical protein